MYAEPLLKLEGLYPHESLKLRISRAEIALLTMKNFTPSQRLDSASLTFDNIRMSLELLKHRSVCLYQEINARMGGLSYPAMNQRMNTLADDQGPSISNTTFRLPFGTYRIAHSGFLPFPNTTFHAIPPYPTSVEGVPPIPSTLSDSVSLFLDPSATSTRSLGFFCSRVEV